jgi:hypothetical protein
VVMTREEAIDNLNEVFVVLATTRIAKSRRRWSWGVRTACPAIAS